MSRPIVSTGLVVSLLLTLGCVSTAQVAEPLPSALRNGDLHFHVENDGGDERSIHEMIARELRKQGLAKVTAGRTGERPDDADVVVVYEDHWQWDMTNYLILLRIDVRDPETNVLLGTASAYQTSLARKSAEEVAAQVVAQMMARPEGS